MGLKLYGASDDLIELEGDLGEEWYAFEDDRATVVFATGDTFEVRYDDDGVWRIEHTAASGDLDVAIARAPVGDEDNYSDVATIEGNVSWADAWPQWPPTHEQISERTEKECIIDDIFDAMSRDELLRLYQTAKGHVGGGLKGVSPSDGADD